MLQLQKSSQPIGQVVKKLGNKVLEKATRWMYRRLGYQLLEKAQTEAFLKPFQLKVHSAHSLSLPSVVDLIMPQKVYFKATETRSEPAFVWSLEASVVAVEQLPYGGLRTETHLLSTDINIDDLYRNVLHWGKRDVRQVQTLLAPWSHYLDGIVWGGYYDFVMLVMGKLCRMKDEMHPGEFASSFVAYPLFDTTYEREFLSLLGIAPERVIDCRTTKVRAHRCIVANIGHWFYPNLADITSLRRHVLTRLPPPRGPRNRIYICRSGRRRVINEAEIISLLRQYGFQILEDKPRSVAEQVEIYQNAEFIIGPHGASFVNILWCQPGTYLMELFAPTYFPDFYRNMAASLHMRYAAYFHGSASTADWADGLEDNIYVSVKELEQCLHTVLDFF